MGRCRPAVHYHRNLQRACQQHSGRWLSRDPSGEAGGLNLYGYADEDPANEVDPVGLCGFWDNLAGDLGDAAADAAALAPALAIELLLGGPEDPLADLLADEYLEGELAADAGAEATDADAVAESGSEASAEAAGPGTTTADDATAAATDADAGASAGDLTGGEDLADASGDAAAEDAPEDTAEQSASGNTSGGSSAGGCFKAGTLVTTPQGKVPIERIKVGDLVESRDPATGKTAFEPVLRLYVHYKKAVDDVILVSAGAPAETIVATPQHPFHVTGIGWVAAGKLKTGEHVDDLAGPPLSIKTVVPEATTQTVYNLDIANFHTYFVGKDQAWVHNTCSTGGEGGETGGAKQPLRGQDATNAARNLGYDQRIPAQKAPFNSHGQPVFSNGKNFITPDVDSHSGGAFKLFDRFFNRIGTIDINGNIIGK